MPVRDRIMWGVGNPFSDPRLANLPALVRDFRTGRLPHGWRGNKQWENRWLDLPQKPPGYYREYYVGTSAESGDLRIVLGQGGEVYISGNHHRDWRQVVAMPVLPAASPRPRSVDDLIATVQGEFPQANIRITGRGRTVRRQAELMAQRRRQNRQQFLQTYRLAPHITEMDQWVTNNPRATEAPTVDAFVDIIDRARRNGAVVSNHLSDTARDISIPAGGPAVQAQVRRRIEQLGGRVIDEHDAVGGAHWHVDF